MFIKKLIMILFVTTFLYQGKSALTAKVNSQIFNEEFHYKIKWMGASLGSVKMKTWLDKKKKLLKSIAKINTFSALKSMYYISGNIGMAWDYRNNKSRWAFEEVYQGKKYQKRSYLFSGNKVRVKKLERTYSNNGYPKKGRGKSTGTKIEWKKAKGFHDLLGAFYYLRAANFVMKPGAVLKLNVLPAGSKKVLILKVMGIKLLTDCPFYGKKYVYVVRSALADSKTAYRNKGGNLFLKTKSPIFMYITADKNHVPVRMWTSVDIIGKIYIDLASYKQN